METFNTTCMLGTHKMWDSSTKKCGAVQIITKIFADTTQNINTTYIVGYLALFKYSHLKYFCSTCSKRCIILIPAGLIIQLHFYSQMNTQCTDFRLIVNEAFTGGILQGPHWGQSMLLVDTMDMWHTDCFFLINMILKDKRNDRIRSWAMEPSAMKVTSSLCHVHHHLLVISGLPGVCVHDVCYTLIHTM